MKQRAREGGKSQNTPERNPSYVRLPSDADWEWWRMRDLWPLRLAVWVTTGKKLEDSKSGNEPQDKLYDIATTAIAKGKLSAYVRAGYIAATTEITHLHADVADLNALPPEMVRYEPVTMRVPVDGREIDPTNWVEFLKEKKWPYPKEFDELLQCDVERQPHRDSVIKAAVQGAARRMFAAHADWRIGNAIREIQLREFHIRDNGKPVSEKTLRAWIGAVAPAHARRSGRPSQNE